MLFGVISAAAAADLTNTSHDTRFERERERETNSLAGTQVIRRRRQRDTLREWEGEREIATCLLPNDNGELQRIVKPSNNKDNDTTTNDFQLVPLQLQ